MAAVPSLIFISGGVRSGKSNFAERTAAEIADATGGKLHYIATSVPVDSEMKERIKKHRQDRENSRHHWNTVEKSVSIDQLAANFNDKDILLLDCLTTLLNNELYLAGSHSGKSLYDKILFGLMALKRQAGTLIVVSNEVLNEPISSNDLVFTYKKLLGHIHQRIVRESDQAYVVEAGIPIVMKKVLT